MSAAPHLRPVPDSETEPQPLALDLTASLVKTYAELMPESVATYATRWPGLPDWIERPHDRVILAAINTLARQGIAPSLPVVRQELASSGQMGHEVAARMLDLAEMDHRHPAHPDHLVQSLAKRAFRRILTEGMAALLADAQALSDEELWHAYAELGRRARSAYEAAYPHANHRRPTA